VNFPALNEIIGSNEINFNRGELFQMVFGTKKNPPSGGGFWMLGSGY
jgi:hypothetical protein